MLGSLPLAKGRVSLLPPCSLLLRCSSLTQIQLADGESFSALPPRSSSVNALEFISAHDHTGAETPKEATSAGDDSAGAGDDAAVAEDGETKKEGETEGASTAAASEDGKEGETSKSAPEAEPVASAAAAIVEG